MTTPEPHDRQDLDVCLPACVPFIERMVDGVRAEDDAALSDHVRGCLPCYRASIELASVAEIGAALTREPPRDPGDLFFASFSRRVAEAWLGDPNPSAIAPAAVPVRRARPVRGLALFGLVTALAAAVWLLVPGAGRIDEGRLSVRAPTGVSRPPSEGSRSFGNDDNADDIPGTEIPLDPVAEIEMLDTGTLARLVDAIRATPTTAVGAGAADIDAVSSELADNLADADNPTAGLTATESLELLGTPALAVLSERLHGLDDL